MFVSPRAKPAARGLQVRLHAPPADRSFLPSWLTSPLGLRRSSAGGDAADYGPAPESARLSTVQEAQMEAALPLGRFHSLGDEAITWSKSAAAAGAPAIKASSPCPQNESP